MRHREDETTPSSLLQYSIKRDFVKLTLPSKPHNIYTSIISLVSGRMYAMKCLYKKRIKMKQGERMAVNERDILARVDTPFIVCLNYAFQTTDRLCFILDLMNGGWLQILV